MIKSINQKNDTDNIIENIDSNNQEVCLIRNYFAKQAKLPANQRKNFVMISCKCSQCSIYCN